jgi:hypothetical protein
MIDRRALMASSDERKPIATVDKAALAAEGHTRAHSTSPRRRAGHKAHGETHSDSDDDSDNQAEPFEKRSEGGTDYSF